LLFFADAFSNAGKCFVVMEKNNADIRKNWKLVDENTARLGSYMLIKEPASPCARYLFDDVPIVESKFSFILLQPPATNFVQPIVYEIPEPNTQRFFLQQNNTTICMHTVSPITSVCNGVLCDRQGNTIAGTACGCYYTGRRGKTLNFVISYELEFKHFAGGKTERVPDTKSWATTKLFFSSLPLADASAFALLETHVRAIRVAATSICAFVNDHGGWTVMGWSKQGVQVDASGVANSESMVTSQTKVVHIVSVQPTTAKPADFAHLQCNAVELFQTGLLANPIAPVP
jgi:hypothetical protein